MLPAHAQRHPTGDQRLDLWTRCQKPHDVWCGLTHLFEVIENEQQFSPGQVLIELFNRRLVWLVQITAGGTGAKVDR